MSKKAWLVIVLLAACLVGAGYLWAEYKRAPVVETAKPAETQSDGSKIAERAPNAKAKPKQMMPKGATLERTAEFEVQGAGIKMPDGVEKPCPPVTVDTSLVRLDDGTKRLLISSPDGQINRAVDVPVETAAPPPEPPKWAVGLSINPVSQTMGIWVERDLSRFRAGVEINQGRRMDVISGPLSPEIRFRLGWVF